MSNSSSTVIRKTVELAFLQPLQLLKVGAPGLGLTAFGIYVLFIPLLSAGTGQVSVGLWSITPGLILALLGYLTFALFWHRSALLDSEQRQAVMRISARHVGLMILSSTTLALITIVLVLTVLLGLFLVASVLVATDAPYFPLVEQGLSFIASLMVGWIVCRNSLIVPAAALSKRMTTSESWRATADQSASILIVLIAGVALNAAVMYGVERFVPLQPVFLVSVQIALTCLQMVVAVSFISALYQQQIIAGQSA
ncbi:hypothetical protein [Roseobacter weihaiensis]|uniref:hypothetical protein n=1 Tax=Roseobacter weihaiensis TaxID=2763262 RepID=UPI001D0A3FA0|nr:hypothetical protein [Roseobacter sp. H9]